LKKACRFKENDGVARKKRVETEQISTGATVGETTLNLQRKAACKLENLQAAF